MELGLAHTKYPSVLSIPRPALPCPPPPISTLVILCLPLVPPCPPSRLSFLNPVPEIYVSDTRGSLLRVQISCFSRRVFLRMVFHPLPDYVACYPSLV